ncbi:MAG: hypothetical protein HYZ27_10830 [Deltaproteobacteria bacterium]|nr:hypothetical protein [Deltaproteobacteria bacterium]
MAVSTVRELNPYQRAAMALDNTADVLRRAAGQSGKMIDHHLSRAGEHAVEVPKELAGALVNVVDGMITAVEGTAGLAVAGGAAAAGLFTGAVGAAGWVVEQPVEGMGWFSHQLSKAFTAIYNWIQEHLRKPNRAELRDYVLADAGGQRFSEAMFERAGDLFRLSKDAADFAWDSYKEAFNMGVLGTAGNVAFAAAHAGMTLAHLGGAALYAGDAAAIKLAELGVRAAKVAVIYAEKGVERAGDAALLAAEATAAVGNALRHEKRVEITQKFLGDFERRLVKMEQAAA